MVEGGDGPGEGLVVERPQILHGAAATGDDDEVRPRDRAAGGQGFEAGDRGPHL